MAGYNVDAAHEGVHPEFSWPTGDANWSFARRLGASSVENFARPQEKLSALNRQASGIKESSFVLVGFGANDLCTGGGRDETTVVPVSVSEFESRLRDGIRMLTANGSSVLVVSIPDIVAMHAVAAMPPPQNAATYLYFGTNCGRTPEQFRAEIQAYNEAILRVTRAEGAFNDGGAVWRLSWSTPLMSEADGVHLSLRGAEAMATAVWDAYAAAKLGE